MAKRELPSIKLVVVGAWLIFSLSLASWWMIFGLTQLDRIAALESQVGEELARHQKMLLWEGGVLLLLLLGGGSALAYFVYQENRRFRQVNEFFATFSHELKTSIASLRLQAESLREDFSSNQNKNFDQHHANLLERLMKDSVRLELQLENSLFLANVSEQELMVEQLPLSRIVETLKEHWPNLRISLTQDCVIRADRRAVESVLKNLIQNSAIHGKATEIILSPEVVGSKVVLKVLDNGVGFAGDRNKLAKLFLRHATTSGSGVGLYLSHQLMNKMGGDLIFPTSGKGFQAELTFQGTSL